MNHDDIREALIAAAIEIGIDTVREDLANLEIPWSVAQPIIAAAVEAGSAIVLEQLTDAITWDRVIITVPAGAKVGGTLKI